MPPNSGMLDVFTMNFLSVAALSESFKSLRRRFGGGEGWVTDSAAARRGGDRLGGEGEGDRLGSGEKQKGGHEGGGRLGGSEGGDGEGGGRLGDGEGSGIKGAYISESALFP